MCIGVHLQISNTRGHQIPPGRVEKLEKARPEKQRARNKMLGDGCDIIVPKDVAEQMLMMLI